MKQQLLGIFFPTGGHNTTQYVSPLMFNTSMSTSLVDNFHIMPVAGTFRNLRCRALTALTGAETRTYTLMKNGAATALTVQIVAGTGTAAVTDSSNSISFAAGDTVSLRSQASGTPAANTIRFSLEFQATNADTSIGGFGGNNDTFGTTTEYEGVLHGSNTLTPDTQQEEVAVAGTLTGTTINLVTAPGAGKTRVFTVMKNGVAQDGAGGTTDTRLTISDAATTGTVTYSLALAVGDRLAMRCSQTGTATSSKGAGATSFVSGTANRWNFGAFSDRPLTVTDGTTLFNYLRGNLAATMAWDTTEADVEMDASVTSFWLTGMRTGYTVAPGAGKSWALTLRVNSSDTVQTVTIADANTSGTSAADPVAIVSGDALAMKGVASNTPTATQEVRWTFAASDVDPAPPPIIGTTVVGGNGTVTSSRTFLANLDGTTRTVHAPGSMYVAGSFVLHELAAAPTAIPNAAILYAIDDGAGKTKLMVLFESGAAQQLSIEP